MDCNYLGSAAYASRHFSALPAAFETMRREVAGSGRGGNSSSSSLPTKDDRNSVAIFPRYKILSQVVCLAWCILKLYSAGAGKSWDLRFLLRQIWRCEALWDAALCRPTFQKWLLSPFSSSPSWWVKKLVDAIYLFYGTPQSCALQMSEI
jgi:hypothetical protein